MSGFLFIVEVKWVMTNTLTNRGLRWRFTSILEDLDYADNVPLLASNSTSMQEKSKRLQAITSFIGLELCTKKTKIMRLNKVQHQIFINGTPLEDADKLVYLGFEMGGSSGAETYQEETIPY